MKCYGFLQARGIDPKPKKCHQRSYLPPQPLPWTKNLYVLVAVCPPTIRVSLPINLPFAASESLMSAVDFVVVLVATSLSFLLPSSSDILSGSDTSSVIILSGSDSSSDIILSGSDSDSSSSAVVGSNFDLAIDIGSDNSSELSSDSGSVTMPTDDESTDAEEHLVSNRNTENRTNRKDDRLDLFKIIMVDDVCAPNQANTGTV